MNDIVEFPIHFDIPKHYLKVNDFVSFSIDIERIVQDFNGILFDDLAHVEVFVLTPESGSFLGKWGIRFTHTSLSIGALFMALDTDISKSFVHGLTGHEPKYYAKMAGSETIKIATLLADTTKGFLEKDTNDNELASINPKNIPNAYHAKDDFYKKCLANKDISGIGFTCDDNFPIKRDNFPYKVSNLVDGDLDLEPEYDVHQLRIISSVNTIESKAQWKFQDVQTRRFLNAHLEDSNFRKDFFDGEYPIKLNETDDVIVAMVEYRKLNVKGITKIIERNIIKVYKFNNISLDKMPKGTLISSVNKVKSGVSEKQITIFDSISAD